MQMSNEEIIRSYREARDKRKQIEILSELNACDKQKIRDILAEGGMDHRSLPRSRRKEKAAAPEPGPAKAKAAKAKTEPAKEKQAAEEKPVTTQCGGDDPVQKEEPEERKIFLPEIVRQAVTEKMMKVQDNIDRDSADLWELNNFLKNFS